MKKIVYVWDADYPWDVRTEKICLSLTEAGHDVHIVARNKAHKPTKEKLPEAVIRRMKPLSFTNQKLDTLLGFPAFFNPRWYNLIDETAAEIGADLIMVRDIPLCPPSIMVGRKYNIPVILDMAENYPAMMQDIWDTGRNTIVDSFVRNPKAVSAVEKWCLKRVTHTIVVVEESGYRLEQLGVPASKISVVSNTPSIDRAAKLSEPKKVCDDKTLQIVYLGIVEVIRGLMESIDAIKLLKASGHNVRLRLIGNGRDLELLKTHASNIGLRSNDVEFLGFIPYEKALKIVGESDVGLIPHHASESWETTIPNKLFDYMSLGLPVVSSDTAPCTRILKETGAGVVFKSGDSQDLAASITKMINTSDRQKFGEAGRVAISEKFNWESDKDVLLKVVDHKY